MGGTFGILLAAAAILPQITSPPPVLKGWPNDGPAVLDASVQLTITPTGLVERCTPLMVSLPSEPTRFCKLVSTFKYAPAKDDMGQPIYGQIITQFHWTRDSAENKLRSPDVDLTVTHLPPGSMVHPIVQTAVIVGADGKVEGCGVAESSGVTSLDDIACTAGLAAMTLQPAKDRAGAPVRSVQSLAVGFGSFAPIILQKDSAYAKLGAAGPYFPERALRLNISGSAIVECSADTQGVLTGCVVKEEIPEGFAFGDAVLQMAKAKWMKAAPGSGERVVIQIQFPASRNFLR